MSSRTNIFAYGSNLDSVQMRRRCPSAVLVGTARLPEHRVIFNRYSEAWQGGVADVIHDPHAEVWGLVWSILEPDLEKLDRFEVVPRGYDRRLLSVQAQDRREIVAWTYQVVSKARHVPPPDRYLEIMLRACERHRFPLSHRRAIEAAAAGRSHPEL